METVSGPVLSDKAYNTLKWICIIVLPALGAFYFGLSQLWGLPEGDKVVQTTTLLGTFLGALVGIASKAYSRIPEEVDGVLGATGVNEDTGQPNLALTINKLPDEVLRKDVVKLRVDSNSASGAPPRG